MTYDLIALGETMLALAPEPGQTLKSAPVLVADHAGAESNTCVGLARLGFRVAWISRIGQDPLGDRLIESLEAEGVDTRFVRRDPACPTGLMLKDPEAGVRYYRAGSAASRLSPADLEGVPIREARAVLVTGVTALIGAAPGAAAAALLEAGSGLRVVDPNLRQGLWGSVRRAELVRPLLERCDLLLAGDLELAEILGRDPAADTPESLARRCASHGPREVVVRSAEQLGALDERGQWLERDARRLGAVDPVGAGDAFNAGYLAVRLRDGPIAEALAAGARCGAAVARQLGDTRGFPRSL